MSRKLKACKHVAALSIPKLIDRLAIHTEGFEAGKDEQHRWVCSVCLKTFGQDSQAITHARKHNHQIMYQEEEEGAGSFYCCLCARCIDMGELSEKQANLLKDAAKLVADAIKASATAIKSTDVSQEKPSNCEKEEASVEESLVGLRPVGLYNLGNTCFMNSTLQALAAALTALKSTSEVALLDGYEDTLGPVGSLLVSTLDSMVIAAEHNLVPSGNKSRNKSASGAVDPSPFLGAFGKHYREFKRMRQQDAHDFLRLLFNLLDNEHQAQIKKGSVAKDVQGIHEKIFGGLLISRVLCLECREVTDTKEPAMDLSLPLQCEAEGQSDDLGLHRLSINDNGHELSLVTLLRYWGTPAKLSGENAFACEACAKRANKQLPLEEQVKFVYRDATQRFFLSPDRLPPILIFHLQRFSMTAVGRRGIRLSKDHTGVSIPKFLDVAPFCLGAGLHILPSEDEGEEEYQEPKSTRYRLTAMVIHEGSGSESGHYVAVVRYADGWWFASDAQVRPASQLSNYNPYLVIYNRIS